MAADRGHCAIVVLHLFTSLYRVACRSGWRKNFKLLECKQISYNLDPVRCRMPRLACPAFTPMVRGGREHTEFCILCSFPSPTPALLLWWAFPSLSNCRPPSL